MAVSSERLCEIEQLLYQWLTKPTATKSALKSFVGNLISFLSVYAKVS